MSSSCPNCCLIIVGCYRKGSVLSVARRRTAFILQLSFFFEKHLQFGNQVEKRKSTLFDHIESERKKNYELSFKSSQEYDEDDADDEADEDCLLANMTNECTAIAEFSVF